MQLPVHMEHDKIRTQMLLIARGGDISFGRPVAQFLSTAAASSGFR